MADGLSYIPEHLALWLQSRVDAMHNVELSVQAYGTGGAMISLDASVDGKSFETSMAVDSPVRFDAETRRRFDAMAARVVEFQYESS